MQQQSISQITADIGFLPMRRYFRSRTRPANKERHEPNCIMADQTSFPPRTRTHPYPVCTKFANPFPPPQKCPKTTRNRTPNARAPASHHQAARPGTPQSLNTGNSRPSSNYTYSADPWEVRTRPRTLPLHLSLAATCCTSGPTRPGRSSTPTGALGRTEPLL